MGTVIIGTEDLHRRSSWWATRRSARPLFDSAGAHVVVRKARRFAPAALLAKTPRKIAKTKDITAVYRPRMAELFEARRRKTR